MQDCQRVLRWLAGWTFFLLLAAPGLPIVMAAPPMIYDFRLVQGTASLPSVKLYADVIGTGDIPVKGLTKESMKAMLGPAEAKILRVIPFEDAKEGVGFVLLVDISKSLSKDQFVSMKETLSAFVDAMSERDRVALVTFGNDVKLIQDFTANRARINEQIAKLELTDDETAFYGGITKAIAVARTGREEVPKRRVIISLTDGVNELSGGMSKGDVAESLTSDTVPLYLIGFFQNKTTPDEESAIGVMKNFSQLSGGRYYDGRGGSWRGIYFAISRAIRNVYLIELDVPNFRSEGTVYPVLVSITAANRTWTEKLKLTVPAGGAIAPLNVKEKTSSDATADKDKKATEERKGGIWIFAGIGTTILLGLGWFFLRRSAAKNLPSEPLPVSVIPPISGPVNSPAVFAVTDPGVLIRLTTIHEGVPGEQFEMEIADRVIIGSDPGSSHLVIEDDGEIAPAHCEIVFESGMLFVHDTGASGGTFLNGVLLAGRQQIEEQDVLRIGHTEMRITFPNG